MLKIIDCVGQLASAFHNCEVAESGQILYVNNMKVRSYLGRIMFHLAALHCVNDLEMKTFENEKIEPRSGKADIRVLLKLSTLINGFVGEQMHQNCWKGKNRFSDHDDMKLGWLIKENQSRLYPLLIRINDMASFVGYTFNDVLESSIH